MRQAENIDTMFALTHGRILTPSQEIPDGTVLVRKGRIAALGKASDLSVPSASVEIDCRGKIVVPGFIDLHVHGGGGFDFCDAEGWTGAARYHALHGTTSILPTICPVGRAQIEATLVRLAAGYPRSCEGPLPNLLGLNLEGPFLNPNQAGALGPDALALPGPGDVRFFQDATGGRIRLMTIAPEIDGGMMGVREMLDAGIVPALGHSEASFEEAQSAFSAGLRHVTHLFNAMRGFHHRSPGCAVAALVDPRITVEVIADGHHLHDGTLRMICRLKGAEGMVLVSDAVPLSGREEGPFHMGGQSVIVRQGSAVNEAGNLSGSLITLSDALRHLVRKAGVPLCEVLPMMTLTPARILGISDVKGRIEPGGNADLVVLSESLDVEKVWIGGVEVARRKEGNTG